MKQTQIEQEIALHRAEKYAVVNHRLLGTKASIIRSYQRGWLDGLENQWISVEDILPEKADVYLTLLNGCVPYVVGFSPEVKQWCNNGDIITHWMPIPSLPKNEQQ